MSGIGLKPNARLLLALCFGVAVLALVLWHFDLKAVANSLARAGVGGFLLVVAAGLVAEIVLALGLWPLPARPLSLPVVVAARQLRDSTADVMPITQLGGVALAARALVLAGMGSIEAAALVTADLTTETFAQGLYVLTGIVASLSLLTKSAVLSPYIGAMLAGALFLALGSIGFALVQLSGSHWLNRVGEKLFAMPGGRGHAFEEIIHSIYRRRGRMALSILLQFAGWIGSGLWLWVVLKVLGLSPGLWQAVAIQALVEGLRSAALFVPASIGIQEAGYAALAPVFGFTPEIGIAVSLLRRGRDVVVAVPVILIWQFVEGRRAAKAGRESSGGR